MRPRLPVLAARQGRACVWRLLVPVVLALAGLLFATTAGAARGTDLRAEETTDLTQVLRAELARVDEQARLVRSLRREVDRLSTAAAGTDSRVSVALTKAQALERAAALAPVEGAALTVTLSDAPRQDSARLPEDVRPDDLVVHQQDLQGVVNALWTGGATAVRIMDQRVIATSAVRCVGNVLILQGRTYSPPYRVTGVGDVDGMRAALDESPTVAAYRYWSEQVGLGYDVSASVREHLPGYEGSLELAHARVAE